jgi:hypothetical protein
VSEVWREEARMGRREVLVRWRARKRVNGMVEYFWSARRVEGRFRPRPRGREVEAEVEEVERGAGFDEEEREEEKESFLLEVSSEGEEGDCGESGDSTGDGSSSRMEISDGEDGLFDSAMMGWRLHGMEWDAGELLSSDF